ncbi:hypothetical protein EJ02DRAFT_65611 [Clathrospora elynae]|uniref:Uncharacterized protein n=1 Tax=Clathrospora elynae TaxID=706981 RepID=A0A6A5SXP3_9PLEO|nr:hypothetical protein EJ02DRAFT_65611 [Clathrospora elynae]
MVCGLSYLMSSGTSPPMRRRCLYSTSAVYSPPLYVGARDTPNRDTFAHPSRERTQPKI